MSDFGDVSTSVQPPASKEKPFVQVKPKSRTKIHKQPRSVQAIHIKLDPRLIDAEIHNVSIEGDRVYLEIEFTDMREDIHK